MRHWLFAIVFLCTLMNLNVYAMDVASQKIDDKRESYFAKPLADQKEFLVDFAITSNDIYNTRTVSRDIVRSVFAIDDQVFLKGGIEVLKSDEDIVGFFTISPCKENHDICELNHLFVKAGLQRNGHGTKLLMRSMELAREKGCREMTFISDPDAQEFYKKNGGRITGYDKNLLNPGVDVPLFAITL